jgi:hypothetical protein
MGIHAGSASWSAYFRLIASHATVERQLEMNKQFAPLYHHSCWKVVKLRIIFVIDRLPVRLPSAPPASRPGLA